MRTAFALLVAASGISGCASHRAAPPPPPPYVVTSIAILPLDNATASVDAPKRQRQALQDRIATRGYVPIPLATVDAALAELGVQLAGQLQVTSYAELHEKLKADVAISGRILSANASKVEAEIAFIDLRTKQVLLTTRRSVEGEAWAGGADELVVSVVVGAVTKHHAAHGRLADVLIGDIPPCPREQPPAPPATNESPAPAP